MSAVPRFRKKPVEVEAVQFSEEISPAAAMDIYRWVESHIGSVHPPCDDHEGDEPVAGVTIDPATGFMVIRTLEGDMAVSAGDWIIRGVAGEFYPCKPDIFEQTYERVEA